MKSIEYNLPFYVRSLSSFRILYAFPFTSLEEETSQHQENDGNRDKWGRSSTSGNSSRKSAGCSVSSRNNDSSDGQTVSVQSNVDGVVNSENINAVKVVCSEGLVESLGHEGQHRVSNGGVGRSRVKHDVQVLQQSLGVDVVEVYAIGEGISSGSSSSNGLSNSLSVGIDLGERRSVVELGHWVRKDNVCNGGSLVEQSVELVGCESGNEESLVVLVSDFPWGASKSSINSSNKSVIRWVDFVDNVGTESNVHDVGGGVLGRLSGEQVNNVSSYDIVDRVHVDQRKVPNSGAGSTISSNSESRGWWNDSLGSNSGNDNGEESNGIAVSELSKDAQDSVDGGSVDTDSSLQASSSIVCQEEVVSIESEPNSNGGTSSEDRDYGSSQRLSSSINNQRMISAQSHVDVIPNNSLNEGSLGIIHLVARSISSNGGSQSVWSGQPSGGQRGCRHSNGAVHVLSEDSH